MGKRRKGREIVLQSFYAARVSGASLTHCLDDQLARREPADESAEFARELAGKVARHGIEARGRVESLLQNWDPERVGLLERLILTMAVTELEHSPDVPYRVVINEACELARRYCDEGAVGFVNGILDRAAGDLGLRDGVPSRTGTPGGAARLVAPDVDRSGAGNLAGHDDGDDLAGHDQDDDPAGHDDGDDPAGHDDRESGAS
ncbi:MAG: transcription antitermination factor NusB [Candidatus Krumholzibacteriia bacterium]